MLRTDFCNPHFKDEYPRDVWRPARLEGQALCSPVGSAFHDARPALASLPAVCAGCSLSDAARRGLDLGRSVTARGGATSRDACHAPGRSRSLSAASVKRAAFHDLERLPPTGSSTRSPCHRRRVATLPISPPSIRPEQFPAPGLDPVRHPQPQPETTCAGQTPPVDFYLPNTTREHTREWSNLAGERVFFALRWPRTGAPDPRAACSGRTRDDARGIAHTGRKTLDPACAQRRRGQLELLPDTSCRRRTVIRPWSGRARGCTDQGPLPPPRANEKASERPRCLRLPASSAEALPPVGNRRAVHPEERSEPERAFCHRSTHLALTGGAVRLAVANDRSTGLRPARRGAPQRP